MPAGNQVRVAHLVHGLRLGGLEKLVFELSILGRERGIEPMVLALGEDGPVRQALEAERVPVGRLFGAPGMSLEALAAIGRALHAFRADVLHAHDVGPWLNAAAARVLRPRTRVLATFHEMAEPAGRRRSAARLAARLTGALVACGAEVARAVGGWAPAGTRLETIGNGVRLPPPAGARGRAEARARLGIPAHATAIGYVGVLRPIKGPDLLLDAFLDRFRGRDDVHLALIGWGPLEEALRARARADANVHFTGMVPDGAALLPALDVYAQLSLSEGRSLSMLEAMAAGLPTVAHALPGVNEIHRDGRTALLVPLRDRAAVGDRLERLVADRGLRSRLGGAARAESGGYAIERTVEAYRRLYRELAERSGE
jgi:glycosyltransferase involved in cell wall biosynthesis